MPRIATQKRKLYDAIVRNLQPQTKPFLIWDSMQHGLAERVQPTGKKAYVCVYRFNGRPRWYTIGYADAVNLKAARIEASNVLTKVLHGTDPQADKVAKRGEGTFAEIAARYVDQHAKLRKHSVSRTMMHGRCVVNNGPIVCRMRPYKWPLVRWSGGRLHAPMHLRP